MDMEAVRNSHFGSLLVKKIRNGEDGDKFKLFSKVIGFDFLKELNSITYFSNGAKDNGVVLFKHNANIERLVAIIKLDKTIDRPPTGKKQYMALVVERIEPIFAFQIKV